MAIAIRMGLLALVVGQAVVVQTATKVCLCPAWALIFFLFAFRRAARLFNYDIRRHTKRLN